MFETAPQSKCAIAYVVERQESQNLQAEEFYLVVIYSISANKVIKLLGSDSKVVAMCTAGDENILITGTNIGSINLYDLKDNASQNQRKFQNEDLNYEKLLNFLQASSNEDGFTNLQEKLEFLKVRYSISSPSYTSDGLPNHIHFSPIIKLVFITKIGESSA